MSAFSEVSEGTEASSSLLIASGTIAAVTADDWFFAPDGQRYRVAFGPCTILRAKDMLGFEPKNSANWFVQVGYGEGAMLIAGCRIHYALICSKAPVGSHVYHAPYGELRA